MLVDPPQLDLVECGIALYWRFVAVELRRKIQTRLACHHDVHHPFQRCDGESVRWIQRRLRRDERPGADAGVLPCKICHSKICRTKLYRTRLNSGKQREQREFVQWSSGKPCILTSQ